MTVALVVCTVASALSPMAAARSGLVGLAALRALIGLMQGVGLPAAAGQWSARWRRR